MGTELDIWHDMGIGIGMIPQRKALTIDETIDENREERKSRVYDSASESVTKANLKMALLDASS
jgi:hypothetical protein